MVLVDNMVFNLIPKCDRDYSTWNMRAQLWCWVWNALRPTNEDLVHNAQSITRLCLHLNFEWIEQGLGGVWMFSTTMPSIRYQRAIVIPSPAKCGMILKSICNEATPSVHTLSVILQRQGLLLTFLMEKPVRWLASCTSQLSIICKDAGCWCVGI